MQAYELSPAGHGTAAHQLLVMHKGDRVLESLRAHCAAHGITAGHFTGIGAFSEATLAFYDRQSRGYEEFRVEEAVEVLALTGNVAIGDAEPRVHTHVTLGTRDGNAIGGHLVEATTWPTLEVSLTWFPGVTLRSFHDDETGLRLLVPGATGETA